MSANIMAIGGRVNSANQKEYIVDSVADIEKLPKDGIRGTFENPADPSINDPCEIGSTALVCEGSSGASAAYILSPSNEWKEL